jgi:hypothetical protein
LRRVGCHGWKLLVGVEVFRRKIMWRRKRREEKLEGGVAIMEELIGHCRTCEKPIYCKMGFLDGVVQADKSLVCFECSGEAQKENVTVEPQK